MSKGMCVICKSKPSKARRDGYGSYCNDCENKYQRERYFKAKASKSIGCWKRRGTKKPPTDWREVLRKTEEQNP